MALLPRPGLFGFLLLLAALAPTPSLAARGDGLEAAALASGSDLAPLVAPGTVDARLSRISAALRQRGLVGEEATDPAESAEGAAGPAEAAEGAGARGADARLAWVFVNAPGAGFRNGGWGNGGFRNGGWGNGGFRNGGWGNGGFRNGGAWRNGGGGAWRNGGFRNHW